MYLTIPPPPPGLCADPAEPELVVRPHSFRVDFGRLLNALCSLPPTEPATLLLYLLLHKSAAFRTYVLSRTDVDTPVSGAGYEPGV